MAEGNMHKVYHPSTVLTPVADCRYGNPLYVFSPDFERKKLIICGYKLDDKEILVIHGYENSRGWEKPGYTVSTCRNIISGEQGKIMEFLKELERKMGGWDSEKNDIICPFAGELVFW